MWHHFRSEYFFRPLPSRPLRIMRVLCGAEIFVQYVRVAPVFLDLYSPKYLGVGAHYPVPRSDVFYYILLLVIFASSAAVTFGWQTRRSLAVLLLTQTATAYLNPSAFLRWGHMVRHYLLFLWLTEPYEKKEFAPAWTWRLFQIQTCLIYLVSQLNRWGNGDWLHGDALLRVLADGDTTRWLDVDWMSHAHVLRALGYFGFGLEWAGAFLILLGPLQGLVALALMVMHVALEFLSKIELWQPFMVASLLFFLPARFFSEKTPAVEYERRPFIGVLIVGFFALALIHAWPKRLLSQQMQVLQEWLGMPVVYSTFSGTARMNMFAAFGHPGRKCAFLLAEDREGRLTTLMRDEPEGCRERNVRWRDRNELVSVILRTQHYNEARKDRVGRYFCHKAKDAAAVFVGRIMEMPDEIESIIYFDCMTHQIRDGLPAATNTYFSKENMWLRP